jgi:NMD protein affecting ribosome stability and mRNA decay
MDTDQVQPMRSRRTAQTASSVHLTTCSICLRVRRGSEWVEAEQVIREIRTYELAALPDLQSAMCDGCAEAILRRRARSGEQLAA